MTIDNVFVCVCVLVVVLSTVSTLSVPVVSSLHFSPLGVLDTELALRSTTAEVQATQGAVASVGTAPYHHPLGS